ALEWYWCRQFGGFFEYFRIGILGIAACVLVFLIHAFPVMAAFRVTMPELFRNTLYFAFLKPAELLLILFVHIAPMVITYADLQRLP
ncbi:hypothetical protein, partial [Pseudomonas aeruginosa]|uniref:hypothetical protein n=1 Tax=Pseudomonas aeruginosa TaxID=287 RepID=UPI00397BD71B